MPPSEKFLHQWHETQRIEEGGVISFLKRYEPNSYEIKNELGWLLSSMLRVCHDFSVPLVKEASIEEGYIKMDFIEEEKSDKPQEEIVDYLVSAAIELHSLLKAEQPMMRAPVSKSEYNVFLKEYTNKRINALKGSEFELPEEIVRWIQDQINVLRNDYFSIVHRDMRARHLLLSANSGKPVLIDWEFSNISDSAQDLAKIIYDATTHDADRQQTTKRITDAYAHARGLSKDELEEHVNAFLPIIPLERSMSLINRKPDGYQAEILKDLFFIRAVYDEKK